MEITGLFGSAYGTAANSSGDVAGLAQNFDDFLTLLTTQLQYQDPLEPMDSTEFVDQLTQFTQVEQTIKQNQNMETLLELQNADQGVSTLGFIGKTVEAVGTDLPLSGGEAEFTYTLGSDAEATTIVILDNSGQAVFSTEGETDTGKYSFVWDGTSSNGDPLPDGVYRIAVAARDAEDQTVETVTTVLGRVDGVQATSSGIVLSMGGAEIPTTSVVSVREIQNVEGDG